MPAAAKQPITPAPPAMRFCRQCGCYKPWDKFPSKRLSTLCNTCLQHNREVADARRVDPSQDQRIAALRQELGPAERVEVNLPGCEHWVQQYIAAHGGIEGAMNRLLAQLEWAEKNKPGSKVVFDIHQFFIKLHFAMSVAREQRERSESPLNLLESLQVMDKLREKYLPALERLSQTAARAVGCEVESDAFTLPEAVPTP